MKKITSAALLAIRLTWKAALLFFLGAAALPLFYGFQELMPGFVPLQTTFGFEELLRSAAQPVGRLWMAFLLFGLVRTAGYSKGSKSVYTMNRLGLSENQMTLVFGAVFTGYFLLYWAFQLAVCYGFFLWYAKFTLVSANTFMLACWRSEWLHTLLPLGEWWGYLRNLSICASFGFTAAIGSQRLRRGKSPFAMVVPPALCVFLLDGSIGNMAMDLTLAVLLIAFTVGFFFAMKGGFEDEDL